MRKLLAGAAAVFMLSSGAVGVMAAGPGSGCSTEGLHGNCLQSGVCGVKEGHGEGTCVKNHSQDCTEEYRQNHDQNCTEKCRQHHDQNCMEDCMINHGHDSTEACEEVHNQENKEVCVNDHRQSNTSGTHHRNTKGSHHLEQAGISR